MVKVLVQREFEHDADKVWAVLEDFGNLSWAPLGRVEVEGSGVGMVRRVYFSEDQPPVVEELELLDAGNRELAYRLPSAPMPAKDYRVSAQVHPLGDGRCRVDWRCEAVPDGMTETEFEEAVKGVYQMMLQWIDDHLRQR